MSRQQQYGYNDSNITAERKFYYSTGFLGGKEYPENERQYRPIVQISTDTVTNVDKSFIQNLITDVINQVQAYLDNEMSAPSPEGMYILESISVQISAYHDPGADNFCTVLVTANGWLYGQY